MCCFGQRRLVEQVEALTGHHFPVAGAVEHLGVYLGRVHVGKAATTVLVDKVQDAGQDLAVFGIATADAAQPFAIQQLAVG
ncbi:hypothetical protein D3C84_990970 [compost metagenome]